MAYIGVSPSNGVRKKHTYTATASQTSFSGAGDEGITLAYRDSNYVDVYQNGVKLADEDYTATSGTAIVLAQGASADDIVEIIAFDVFSVADTVSKADGGTFDGNVTMAGTLGVTGVLTANGGAVFNEGGADVDFRVESDTVDHALFVDGATGKVGIGVVPEAWQSTRSALQVGDSTAVWGDVFKNSWFTNNVYRNSSNNEVYINDSYASEITMTNGGVMDFKVAPSGSADATISWTTAMSIANSGAVTMPNQPAFSANKGGTDQTNMSVGEPPTVVTFGTEIYDRGANFASNTFTAPLEGLYQFNVSLYLNQVDSASDYYVLQMATSNRNYQNIFDPDFGQDAGFWTFTVSVLADMDASDTVQIKFFQNNGTAQTEISGSATATFFTGYLVC
jgi:hypothetical protein